MTIDDLLSAARAPGRPILFDGGMGTQLIAAGVKPGAMQNLQSPETVRDIHRRYVEVGAQVLLTNTFSGNRLAMARDGCADQIEAVNREAVRLAREASNGMALVAGDLSSTGEFLEPYGDLTEEELLTVYKEQITLLEGVDLFLVETFIDPREIAVALRACKETSNAPVAATMSFDATERGMRTVMGTSVEECVNTLIAAGADIIGANCGSLAPEEVAAVVAQMRGLTDRPILAQPNAGKPQLIDGVATYRLEPEGFAKGMREVIAAGANCVGGCCGTTPEHIRALKGIL